MKKLLVVPVLLVVVGACAKTEERVQPVAQQPTIIEREKVIERQGGDQPIDVHIHDR